MFRSSPIEFTGGPEFRWNPQALVLGSREELLQGARIDYPSVTGANVTFKKAPKALQAKDAEQGDLELYKDQA